MISITTKFKGELMKILFFSLKTLTPHPRRMEIRSKSANWLPAGYWTIFFITDMTGTIKMKNKIPTSTLKMVTIITGKATK
jgi:hypothetical protein